MQEFLSTSLLSSFISYIFYNISLPQTDYSLKHLIHNFMMDIATYLYYITGTTLFFSAWLSVECHFYTTGWHSYRIVLVSLDVQLSFSIYNVSQYLVALTFWQLLHPRTLCQLRNFDSPFLVRSLLDYWWQMIPCHGTDLCSFWLSSVWVSSNNTYLWSDST